MKNHLTDTKTTIKTFIIGFTLLAAGTLSLFYWGSRKQVWFCDEIYTYESANGFEQDWPAAYHDEWMSGKDVEAFFAADTDTLSLNAITIRLYNDHVPLYFWLFRMVSFFFFKGSGSIWIGLSLNLLFYLFFLGYCYKLFLRLLNNPMAAGVILLLTCVVSNLMIEHITVLRMYMMLLLAEEALLLGGFWILAECKKDKFSSAVFLYLFAVSVFGFLTHYDYWIFYAVVAASFCLWLLFAAVRKMGRRFYTSAEFRYAAAWVGCFVLSILATIWIFPYCRWNLNRGKGQTALHSLFVFSREKAEQILWGYRSLSDALFGDRIPAIVGIFLLFGCLIGGGISLYRKKKYYTLSGLCLTVFASQLYQLIVCFTMPDVPEVRYLWGSFTIVMLCMAFSGYLVLQDILSAIKNETMRRNVQWFMGIVLSVCILTGQLLIVDNGRNVAYLFREDKNVDLLRENDHIPWIVYGPTVGVYSYYDWLIPEQICFLTENNTPEDAAAVRELSGEKFILYIYESYLPDALAFFEKELDRSLEAVYLTKSTNLNVYLVE